MKSTNILQEDDPFKRAALAFAKKNPGKTWESMTLEQDAESDARAREYLKNPKLQAAFAMATSKDTPSEETSTLDEAPKLEQVVEQINRELAEAVPFHFGQRVK